MSAPRFIIYWHTKNMVSSQYSHCMKLLKLYRWLWRSEYSNAIVTCTVTMCFSGLQCLPQRSALLKSILNFFKKVIPEPALSFADSIRHIMEGTMPKALQHVISNAEYYGASLFLLGKLTREVFAYIHIHEGCFSDGKSIKLCWPPPVSKFLIESKTTE